MTSLDIFLILGLPSLVILGISVFLEYFQLRRPGWKTQAIIALGYFFLPICALAPLAFLEEVKDFKDLLFIAQWGLGGLIIWIPIAIAALVFHPPKRFIHFGFVSIELTFIMIWILVLFVQGNKKELFGYGCFILQPVNFVLSLLVITIHYQAGRMYRKILAHLRTQHG